MATSQGPRKRLPETPSEENLRKQAKQLAKQEGLQLAAAQRHLAIEYGYRNWAELIEAVANRLVPFLPLRELVVFPHDVYPIYIGRGRSIKAIEAAEKAKGPILLVAQRDAMAAAPCPADMYDVGTLGVVGELQRLPDGTIRAVIEGKKRARVSRYRFDREYGAEVEEIKEPIGNPTELDTMFISVVFAFAKYAQGNQKIAREIASQLAAITAPSVLSDKIVRYLNLQLAEQQALLEAANPVKRLKRILGYLST